MAQSAKGRSARGKGGDGGPPREEEQKVRERTDSSDEEPRGEAQEGDGSGPRLSAKELTEAALATIADLTGYEPESVAGLQWDGESWLVTVDVLELARIPNTTDVLASYVVQLDDNGGLLGYKRSRRFVRGQVEGE
jgi:Gas vesicle synthesis protein GvpO